MFKKIVVPLDGSSLSERALPYAVILATEFKSELLLLQVIDENENSSAVTAQGYLKNLQSFLTGQGLPDHQPPYSVRLLLANGDPAEQIIETIKEYQANIVIMSTHGRTGLSRVFSGSITRNIMQEVTVPLMLVHPMDNTKTELAEIFRNVSPDLLRKHIIVPLDGSPLAETALATAVALAEVTNSPIDLIDVLPSPEDLLVEYGAGPSGYIPQETNLQAIKEEALDYLLVVETERLPASLHVNTHIVSGKPGSEIVRHAKERDAGLIILASHTRKGVGRAVLGSVAEEILQLSGIPVIIINRKVGHISEISQ